MDGLDMIEKIEHSFGISYEDDEINRIETVGDLCDSVINKVGEERLGNCLSIYVFYTIRHVLMEKLGFDRRTVTPTTNPNDLVPKEKRIEILKVIEEISDLEMPCLRSSSLIDVFSAFFLLLSPILIKFFPYTFILAADLVAITFLVLVQKANVFEEVFPGNNLRDYIELIVALNFKKLSDRSGSVRGSDIVKAVKTIVGNKAGIDVSKIPLEARIVKDLGIC